MNTQFKCPKCESPIYSRRHKKCGQCGNVLPDHLLFTPEQIRELDEQMERERKQAQGLNLGGDSIGFTDVY